VNAPIVAGAALWIGLALPFVRAGLEARLVTHVLLQLLGLATAGYLIGVGLRPHFAGLLDRWNRYGATGLALAISTGAIWMLPRSIDASLDSGLVESAKFVSLPLLLGVPLALSWLRFGAVLRGFLKANFLSMMIFFGWLYIAAPVRLCNSYLTDDQTLLGTAFLVIAAVLSVLWSAPLFFSSSRPNEQLTKSASKNSAEDGNYELRPIH
jgi:hypothetical protein